MAGSTCTLPDAIAAANTDTTVGGCSIIGTPGTETLLLTAATYSVAFNASYNVDGSNATPSVNVSDPTALPETDQPQQPQLQMYLLSLEAVKE